MISSCKCLITCVLLGMIRVLNPEKSRPLREYIIHLITVDFFDFHQIFKYSLPLSLFSELSRTNMNKV